MTRSAVVILDLLDDPLLLMLITKRSGLDKSTISRQIMNMETKDLLARQTGEDKRFSYFSKTQKEKKNEKFIILLKTNNWSPCFSWTEQEKQMLIVLLDRFNSCLSTC